MNVPARFEGKVALITGGASGMGRATALRFAAEGADVLAIDVNADGLDETATLAPRGSIRTRVCDVAQRSQCFAAVAACVADLGRLDVLANVAGVLRVEHATHMSEEQWNLVLGVNLSGPFFLSQAAIPHLLETQGNIVNVASNAGILGQAYVSAYCASKAGLINLTRALAMEYLKSGIRINAIAPSGTNTPMRNEPKLPEGVNLRLMTRMMERRPTTEPEEIAAAIAFLASDEAKSVHGAIWAVDNGVTAG